MKNLKELNKKIWYRLLKVFYILLFFIILFLTITLNYTDLKHLLIDNEISFTNKKNASIKSSEYELKNNDEYDLMVDVKAQGGSKEDFQYILKKVRLEKRNLINIKPFTELNFEKEKYSNFATFIIGRYYELFLYALLLYIIFFQVINRIFYYIIFGKLIPKKD